jgi:hypothetical protein
VLGPPDRFHTPFVLLLLAAVSYAPLVPWLGFYWDDWPAIWVLHSLGAEGLKEYTAADRPFLGWLYALTMPALGESPLAWHLFAVATRWFSAVAFWWCLRGLWPARSGEIAAAACLFMVYPGFTLQPIAWCHSHIFLEFGLVLLSLGAMVWAHRLESWYRPLMVLAVSCAAVTMMISEYFVGLELLRPLLLCLVLFAVAPAGGRLIPAVVRSWLPFIAVLGLYLVWRLILFHPTGVNDESRVLELIHGSPLTYMVHRFYAIAVDVLEAGVVAWIRTVAADMLTFDTIRSVMVGSALAMTAGVGTFWYLKGLDVRSNASDAAADNASAGWVMQALLVGLAALFAGGLPFWFGNREIRLDSLTDRYTVPVMLGCTLVLAAAIQAATRKAARHIAVISLLVGLSVMFHFRNTVQFVEDWSSQTQLMWQLSWRAPALKPGTLLLADEAVVAFPRSYSLLGPVNFLYAPGHQSRTLEYGFFALPTVLGDELSSLADGVPFRYGFRNVSFTASTSEGLVLWFAPPSCLRILDPSRDEIPHLPPLARAARTISHADRILPHPSGGAMPPQAIFGREPAHSWCYYFQKADLARQAGDWPAVAHMGDEARRLGLAPDDSTEWLPFLEGYLQTGRHVDAEQLLAHMVDDIPAVRSVPAIYDANRVNRRPIPQVVPAASPALCRVLAGVESWSPKRVTVGCAVS